MKVLVFTTLFPNNIWPNHGVFIKERMARFAKLDGCEVKVIAPVPYFPAIKINWRWNFSQIARQEIREGIEVYHPRYLVTPKVGMVLYGWMMFFSVLRAVKKLQKDFKFDLIDAHFVYPDGFAAVLLGWLFKKPVVVSARGSDINLYADFPLIRRLLQFTLRKADEVISVCMALKEAMIDLGVPANKINVVPNGVDIQKFHVTCKATARKELGLPENRKIILSVGSLIPRKGFDLLIRSLKILSATHGLNDLYVVIVGEGPSRKELENLIASLSLNDHVRLAGAVPHQDLHLWYSAADLSCLASSREGWPNVLLESLSCGTSVVATNTWGVPEIITSDEIGLLTERSEAAIAQAILVALKKRWQTETLVEYAKKHTWHCTALGVLRVFQSVLKKKSFLDKRLTGKRVDKENGSRDEVIT